MFSKMHVTCKKNVCKSQNGIKPFCPLFSIDYHCVFASPTSSPGKYGRPIQLSGLSELLKVHRYLSKVTKWDVCKSQKSVPITKQLNILQNTL